MPVGMQGDSSAVTFPSSANMQLCHHRVTDQLEYMEYIGERYRSPLLCIGEPSTASLWVRMQETISAIVSTQGRREIGQKTSDPEATHGLRICIFN
jgi:hypothetical protein